MPPVQVIAYPLLLAAIYGVYRVGRRRNLQRLDALEITRLTLLALGLGVILFLQVRLALGGQLDDPGAVLAAVLSIAAVSGLLGIGVMDAIHVRKTGAATS